jgi:YHYH protein
MFLIRNLALMMLATSVFARDETGLPLGDGKLSANPTKGSIMSCMTTFPDGGGAHKVGKWIKNGVWFPAQKPIVAGNIVWPNSQISISVEGESRIIRANNLPTHATGEFPISPTSKAYEYDKNPNKILKQTILLRLPANPAVAGEPSCVPMGMIGFASSGTAIFNAFDLAGRDAPAYEIQDKCNGHPEPGGSYHYHDWSPCLESAKENAAKHSKLVGFILDGFPIYGPRGEGGVALNNTDLDACHGHIHDVMLDGQLKRSYHYHFTKEYPYTIGCFAGKVKPELMYRKPPPNHWWQRFFNPPPQ